MSKIYSIFAIELKEGVQPEAFVEFIKQKYAPMAARIGWTGYAAIGDRGERKGKCALIWDFESIEQRDRMVPTADNITLEALGLLGADWDTNGKIWDELVASATTYTDYVVQ